LVLFLAILSDFHAARYLQSFATCTEAIVALGMGTAALVRHQTNKTTEDSPPDGGHGPPDADTARLLADMIQLTGTRTDCQQTWLDAGMRGLGAKGTPKRIIKSGVFSRRLSNEHSFIFLERCNFYSSRNTEQSNAARKAL